MTNPVTLGEIRVFDDGDGVIDLKKDRVTDLNNVPIDSFTKDLRVQMVMQSLGVKSLQGVALSPAATFMTRLSETRRLAREGEVREVRFAIYEIRDLARRNGFGFSDEAAQKIFHDAVANRQSALPTIKDEGRRRKMQEELREERLAWQVDREVERRWGRDLTPSDRAEKRAQVHDEILDSNSLSASDIASARAKVHSGEYRGGIDALQELFGTDIELSPDLKAGFNRLSAEARFQAWSAIFYEKQVLGLTHAEVEGLCWALVNALSSSSNPTSSTIDRCLEEYKRQLFSQ